MPEVLAQAALSSQFSVLGKVVVQLVLFDVGGRAFQVSQVESYVKVVGQAGVP